LLKENFAEIKFCLNKFSLKLSGKTKWRKRDEIYFSEITPKRNDKNISFAEILPK
jgi:hypothetical protein